MKGTIKNLILQDIIVKVVSNKILKIVTDATLGKMQFSLRKRAIPAGNYIFKVNNISTRTRCEICPKLTIKIPERRRRRSGVFIVNFENISHLVLVFFYC